MLKNNFHVLFCMVLFPVFIFSQVTLPYSEKFGGTPTQSQWDYSFSSQLVISNPNVGSPSGEKGCLMYNFYNSLGASTYHVISPILESSGGGWIRLTFDFAAANRYTMPVALQTVFADDHIILEYSTDEGATYTEAHNYEIGVNGELNTAGILTSFFTNPTPSQWVTKSILLPAGTNRVKFKGFKNLPLQAGNFAYLDNVIFEECSTPVPTGSNTQQFCAGNTISQLVVSGTNIQWYDTGGNLLSPTTPLVSGTTYYASQTVNLCESLGRLPVTVVSGGCLSVDDVNLSQPGMTIYPNPVEDILHIQSKQPVKKVVIYNMIGGRTLEVNEKEITSVHVGHLVKGAYMVEIYFADGKKISEKIIKN